MQDEKAYIAGERAGLLRAFRETLPAQRTLGELASGLNRLQIQVDNDRLHARQAATTVAELATKLQVCSPLLGHPLHHCLPHTSQHDPTHVSHEVMLFPPYFRFTSQRQA